MGDGRSGSGRAALSFRSSLFSADFWYRKRCNAYLGVGSKGVVPAVLTVEGVSCGHAGAEERPLLPESFVVFGTVLAVAGVDGGIRTASFHKMRPRIAVQVVQRDGEAAILTSRR